MADDPLSSLHDDWHQKDDHLVREWSFPDFSTALAFVVRIGAEAERANHHPDIELGWGRVVVNLTTHDEGAVTDADYELARAIDGLESP